MKDPSIFIKGARMHNLKNIDVHIPVNKLTVITGVSGSGKSSLVMDTLFAEGQRRYVESLSAYARQFMQNMSKPDVDYIDGLMPAIAIHQKTSSGNTRSTVGSMTEISDYFRILFAKIGKTYSPVSGKEVTKHQVSDVIEFIKNTEKEKRIYILIPFPEYAKKNPEYFLQEILEQGFTRIFHAKDESLTQVEDVLQNLKKKFTKDDYILIDRIVSKDFEEEELHRLADSVQTGFSETNGDVFLYMEKQIHHFNARFEQDGILFEEPTPNMFSANNPLGACKECEGFGTVIGIDHDLVIPNKNLSIYDGAVACWSGDKMSRWKDKFIKKHSDFPIHRPVHQFNTEEYDFLWETSGGIHDFFDMVKENLYKMQYRILLARYRGKTQCPDCRGSRIRKEVLYVKIRGTDIADIYRMPIDELGDWLKELTLTENEISISKRILLEIESRIDTLLNVGLNYLTLERAAHTLSGGESQRIQLTRVIGSNLSDSLYILDEPSIGLHSRDTHQLISVLKNLKALGNTVVVVEHDEMMMREADHIIDMGPLASRAGGEVVCAGDFKTIRKHKKSLTAQYLNGDLKVGWGKTHQITGNKIILKNCYQHNLKNIDVTIPLNAMTVISGVSGSGKTTLVKDILYPALKNAKGQFDIKPGHFGSLEGDIHCLNEIEFLDQNPIGRSSRSNPVSYIKAYDDIRNLFSRLKLSKVRGYGPGHFSFNVDGGRCDTCKGEGEQTIEMQFLADVRLICEQCKGKRFKDEILEIKYQGRHIADVLEMSVDEAIVFFEKEKKLAHKLQALSDVGLGYVQLGQSSSTLSGGEGQRIKLASFILNDKAGSHTLFIFDEPTTGLHFHDVQKLLQSIQALIEKGNSVVIIEHNLDVIRNADRIIELGPEGGKKGGFVVFEGSVNALKKCKNSPTAGFLN